MIHSPNILIALKLLMAVACGGAIGFERDLDEGHHELRFAVVTSLDENSRLMGLLPAIGTEVQGSTAAGSD
jgi:hypothetical protein